jgi:protein arginine kinase activator
MNLAQLLAGLLKEEQGQKSEGEAAGAVKCDRCGLSFRQYRKTMLLGCSECYQAFEKHLAHDLRRYHGTVRHVGQPQPPELTEVPETPAEPPAENQIETLQKRLDLAIKDEDFELAAQLRDEITRLKAKEKKQS